MKNQCFKGGDRDIVYSRGIFQIDLITHIEYIIYDICLSNWEYDLPIV